MASNTPDSQAYLGRADSTTQGSDFTASQFQIDQTLANIRTGVPVQVVRAPYDSNGNAIPVGSPVAIGLIDVQPLVHQIDGYGNITPHGVVYGVPYHRYQSGNGAIISDPAMGDQGHLAVNDRDISTTKSTNAAAAPGSRRKFSLNDGIYFGQTQGSKAPTQYLAFLAKGFNMVDSFGNTLVGTANGVLINGCLIKLNGDVVTKHGTSLDMHQNTLVTKGTDLSGPPP
jgi:hypothetical protein